MQPRRRRQMVLSDSSSDEAAALPPSSIEMPSPAVPARMETRERRRAWESIAIALESVRTTRAMTARTAAIVP